MHLLHSDFRIIRKRPNQIEFEVNSGRYYILILLGVILLFQPSWVFIPGLTLIAITWTYDRRWILNISDKTLHVVSRVIWISLDDETFDRTNMVDIVVKYVSGGENGGKVIAAMLQIKGEEDRQLFLCPQLDRVMEFVALISKPLELDIVREIVP